MDPQESRLLAATLLGPLLATDKGPFDPQKAAAALLNFADALRKEAIRRNRSRGGGQQTPLRL